jgi:5-methylcytosine-specific restriction enzyme A
MNRPMQYCAQPGCAVLVARGKCPRHAVRENAAVRRWYCTVRWSRLRQQVCVEQAYACAQCGQVQLQLEVDHIRKHEGSPGLFWDRTNLQALCTLCHTRKTRRGA